MTDLDELAAKGRARKAAAQESADLARRRAEQKKQVTTNKVLQRSLQGSGDTRLFMIASCLVIVGATTVVALPLMRFDELAGSVCMGAGIFGGTGLVTVITMWMRKRNQGRELKWLQRLPFALDIDGYLAELSKGRGNTRAWVELVFAEPVAAEARETLQAAALAVEGVEHADFTKKGTLRIHSEPMQTWFVPGRERETYHSNAAVHRWFRQVADGPISAILRRHPLERVDFGAKE